MKRAVVFSTFLLAILTIGIVSAWAKGPADVANTIHNLSATGVDPLLGTSGSSPYATTNNVSEICVFCHTPHGGLTQGPLWNRNLPSATYSTHYSSTSLTLGNVGWNPGRVVGDQSRLCLSCHDGSATLEKLINPPNTTTGPVGIGNDFIVLIPGVQGGVIGNLTDDHPISFSYDQVQAQAIYGATGARAGELHTVAEAKTAGARFFGSNNMVECSSCHDPHVFYNYTSAANRTYAPFLNMSNAGSNLCLACHNK